MLYVDEPIGVGFSYGTDSATSTVTAAEYVWKFLQNFYVAVSCSHYIPKTSNYATTHDANTY